MNGEAVATIRRRAASVSGVVGLAVALTFAFIPLLAFVVVVDLVRFKFRFPLARLLAFAVCWAWLETAGVSLAAVLWITGRRKDVDAHYRLQRWWANSVMSALRSTCAVVVEVDDTDELLPGPTTLLVRHASLADSLLTAWIVADNAQLQPRVVLKKELLFDPCLDIVGNRLPNCFVDRGASDSSPTLAAIERMGATMTPRSAAIIFPEGTRANPSKRAKALEKITERDSIRAERLAGLANLLPPRPSGTLALLRGAHEVGGGVTIGWHTGFDGLDSMTGILNALGRGPLIVTMRFRRIAPPPSFEPEAFGEWLDRVWLDVDHEVSADLKQLRPFN